MKKSKIIVLILAIAAIFAIVCTVAYAANNETEPALKIEAANLSFNDSVYLVYAVSHEGISAENVRMLFWNEPQADLDSYKVGTESYLKAPFDPSETVLDTDCIIFLNNELRAKNMADYVYARAYAVVDGVEYYSDVTKYSILQYAYNKLGYTGTESTNTALKNMLTSMLNYGADAQTYFEYNTARLANGEFYQIKVDGGALEDGFTKGLYLATETATLTAPEKDGFNFAGWQNSAGEIVSTDNPLTLTDFSANETYTATYEEAVKYSEGLAFISNGDGTCYVSGIGTCKDTDIVIPPTSPEGHSVTSIGFYAFVNCDSLTSVVIGDSVTSIGYYAFGECDSLTSVVIGHSVTSIGSYAFRDCDSLTSIVIPDSVTNIGSWAFYNCDSLTSVVIGESVTSIGSSAFHSCSSLTSVVIPDSVTSIGEGAFSGCDSLTSVVIPDSVTSIGSSAFSGCFNLASVVIPDSVTSIGDYAFEFCTSLTSVVIPDSVTSIGSSAFSYCYSLTSVVIGDSVTSIGNGAFRYCYKLVEVINKSSLDITAGSSDYGYAGYYAKEVHTGESKIVNYSDYLFYTYDNINYLLGYIGNDTNLVLPESYNGEDYEIYESAFSYCYSLTSVVIPDSVTSIGKEAFCYCYKLVEVINKSSFNITAGSSDYGYAGYYAIEVHTGESKIVNYNDYLFYTYDNINYLLGYIGNDSELVLPESYNGKDYEIYKYAFYECNSLTSVVIGDSVTSIGDYAFSYCYSLTSVVIPDSVTSIGSSAFEDCTSLTSVVIPDSVTRIEDYAFSSCDSLTSAVIGDSVTSIGKRAFYGCDSLTSIVIPDSVTSIGSDAFSSCFSLSTVYYTGTADEWSSMTIGSWNDRLTSATRYYYSEAAPTESGNFWHYDGDGEIAIWQSVSE